MAEESTVVWGDTQWKDDDKVRVIHGETYEPWRSWDACSGPWKFPAGLMQFLLSAGFKSPTQIQAHTWPVLMDGKDVIGVAKTGSGKTLGYLLPGYIKVKREQMKGNCDVNHANGPAMLVMAPTRELCQQIFEESDRFGKPAEIKTACVFGGAPKHPQVRCLWDGPHCVCATPGRLSDFLRDGSIKLSHILYLVLDEADRMLDMGFKPQIDEITSYIPVERQTALYTATWPKEVKQIADTLTRAPTHIQVGSTDSATTNADITQNVVKIHNEADKMRFLEEDIFPKLQRSGGCALLFVKTKKTADQLYQTLSRAGAPIVCLHGDLDQMRRDQSLYAFKNGKAKVLVATDVAQRGLDIKNVQCVINYDAAGNVEDYVHRIGRTGRAGEKGDAYTLLYDHDRGPALVVMTVMRKSGQEVPPVLKEIVEGGGSNLTGQWTGRYSKGGGKGGGGYGGGGGGGGGYRGYGGGGY